MNCWAKLYKSNVCALKHKTKCRCNEQCLHPPAYLPLFVNCKGSRLKRKTLTGPFEIIWLHKELCQTYLKAIDSRIARTRWLLVVEGFKPMKEAHAFGSFRGAYGIKKLKQSNTKNMYRVGKACMCESESLQGTKLMTYL